MVGIVTGNELGLDTSSLAKLGSAGIVGDAKHGRGGEAVYVNAATGNLVLQQRDEIRIGQGPDAELVRTYNSLGQLSEDPDAQDNWLPGWSKQVLGVSGTINTQGSTVLRRDAQGALVRYSYWSGVGSYISNLGEGARDTLYYSASTNTWTWTEGSSRVKETYGAFNGLWRITSRVDVDNNTLAYTYDAQGRLSALSTASGERIELDYQDARLSQVRSLGFAGVQSTRTRYTYDTAGRLCEVIVDLTPDDNAISDGNFYRTRYGYDGSSTRIASLAQSDGSELSFAYTQGGDGMYRVARIVEDPNGLNRTTEISYDLAARSTSIRDASGAITVMGYDTAGHLLSIQAQSVEGVTRRVSYSWDNYDNVVGMTDALGRLTTYAYTSTGVRVLERDSLGNTVTRQFSNTNQVLSETRYGIPDPDGPGSLSPSSPQVTRYVYDANTFMHLRFQISAEGEVREFRYDNQGQLTQSKTFLSARYDVSNLTPTTVLSESTLVAWAAAQEPSRVQLTEYSYDLRGQLERETNYTKVDGSGVGIGDGSESVSRYVYGPRGELLHKIDPRASRLATFWSQDFSVNSAGLSTLPSSCSSVQFGRLDTWSKYISGQANTLTIFGTRNQSVGTVFRGELTTGAASPTRYLRYGADNANSGGVQRRHMVFFSADGMYATYQDDGVQNVYLGRAKDNTAYVVEVATDANGSTLYVYEKGAARASGFSDRRQYADWGATRTAIELRASPTVSASSLVSLDNLSERDALDPIDDLRDRNRPFASQPAWVTSLLYDGMGRQIASVDGLGNKTLTQYDDASRRTLTTLSNGLIRTTTFDRTGARISDVDSDASGALGTTRYLYDSAGRLRVREDATGVRNHLLYDAAGRKVAEIDGEGALTEYRYSALDQVICVIGYATRLSSDVLANLVDVYGTPATTELATLRPTASSLDRRTWTLYDGVGRVAKSIDALGAVTERRYDGTSQLIQTIAYAARIDVAAINTNTNPADTSVSPGASNADRSTRFFYDASGKLRATLDAEGYLSEQRYDAAGQRVQSLRYASVVPESLRASGSLSALLQSVSANPNSDDQVSYRLFDGKGQLVGEVDALNFLTEYTYDVAGNRTRSTRYANAVSTQALGAPSLSLDNLRPSSHGGDRRTDTTYDALNRTLSQRAPDGTRTTFTYDAQGLLLATTRAVDTAQARTQRYRYDGQGRLIAELSPNAAATLGTLTDAQAIEAYWQANATRHTYDAAGRRTSTTDALGRRNVYLYDREGRLLHTVNALVGEVRSTRYDALGQVTRTQGYRGRLANADLNKLTGGLTSASVETLIGALASGSSHSFALDAAGQVLSDTDALGNAQRFAYNSFGEQVRSERALDVSRITVQTRSYDRRGLLTATTTDPDGLALTTRTRYDAFGRRLSESDAKGLRQAFAYDRLGRVIELRDGLNQATRTTYDAFGQVLSVTDRTGQVTRYRYDLAQRQVEITTAEGILTSVTRNAHGETVESVDARGARTTTEFDANGNQIASQGPDGARTRAIYDAANRLIERVDARGTRTVFSYDGVGRITQRIVDPKSETNPNGLHLTTQYRYDGEGQAIWTHDANGIWTQSEFNAMGQLVALTRDPKRGPDGRAGEPDDNPQGLNLRTETAYDAQGHVLSVIEGAGSASARKTTYVYDVLGRRIEEHLDPQGLNLTTRYAYDARGNLIARTDARGQVIRYAYDGDDRMVFTIDALNQVTRRVYDAQGRQVEERRYAKAAGTISEANNPQTIEAALIPDTTDRITRQVFDADGRLRYRIDAQGAVTGFTLDGNGNVIRETRYANAVSLTSTASLQDLQNTLKPDAADRLTRHVFDAANRKRSSVDALGYVNTYQYDANGNLSEETRHANAVTLDATLNPSVDQLSAALTPSATEDRRLRHLYDAADRESARIDALGYLTAFTYDALGQVLSETRHANALSANQTLADLRSDNARDARTRHTYDAVGREIQTARRIDETHEAITTQSVDTLGQVVRRIDANGNARVFAYDGAGRLILQIDPLGFVTQNTYDGNGALTQIMRYANAIQGNWDASHLPQIVDSATNASGTPYLVRDSSRDQQTSFEFDALGRQTKLTDAEGNREITSYNTFGDKATFTNKAGGTFIYRYDALGHQIEEQLPVRAPDASGQLVAVINRSTFNAFGEKANQTDAASHAEARTVTFTYDALGRLKSKQLPAVSVYNPVSNTFAHNVRPTESWDYDGANNAIRYVDANGNVTLSYYDALNRSLASVNPCGVLSCYTLDAFGNMIAERVYANAVRVGAEAHLDIRTPPEVLSTLPSNASIRVFVLADADNDRVVLHSYDARGSRLASRIDQITVGGQDAGTNRFWVVEQSIVTSVRYDALGNALSETDANGNLTRHIYDRNGAEVARVDPARYVTVWTRDAQGRVLSQTRYANPLAQSLTLAESTTLVQLTDASVLKPSAQDRITIYSYDRLGRKVSEILRNVQSGNVDASTGNLSERSADAQARYRYTALDQVSSTDDAEGETRDQQFDVLGRATRIQGAAFVDYTGKLVRPTAEVEYNALGLVVRQIQRGTDDTSESDDRITLYRYDAAGRVSESRDPAGQWTRYERDAQGNITQKTWLAVADAAGQATDIATRYRYDGLHRQTQTHDVGSGAITEEGYNAFGQRIGKRTFVGEAVQGWDEFSVYDRAGRAWKSNVGDGITHAYVFDANGNATLKIDSATTDMRSLSLDQISALSDISVRATVFDARNQAVEYLEPSILSDRVAASVSANQSGQSIFFGDTNVIDLRPAATPINRPTLVNVTDTGSFGAAQGAIQFNTNVSIGWNTRAPACDVSVLRMDVTLPSLSAFGAGDVRLRITDPDSFINVDRTLPNGILNWGQPIMRSGSRDVLRYAQTVSVTKKVGLSEIEVARTVTRNVGDLKSLVLSVPTKVLIINQPTQATRVLFAYRPLGSSGAWTWRDVPPVYNTLGYQVQGYFAFDRSPLNGARYEIQYVALEREGKVVNKQFGELDLRNPAVPSASQSRNESKIGGAGRALFGSDGQLHLMEQGDANALTLRYRIRGSNADWSTRSDSPPIWFQASTLGWFAIPHTTFLASNTVYELDFVTRNAQGVINRLRAEYSRDSAGVATLSALRPYSGDPILVDFDERPDARSVLLGYRPAGSNASYTEVLLQRTSAGRFTWDASQLVPDPSLSTDFEIRVQARDEGNLILNQTRTSLRLGAGAGVIAAGVSDAVPVYLRLSVLDARAERVRLVVRRRDVNEDYQPLTAVRNGTQFIAQLPGIDTKSAESVSFEYLFEVLDAQANVLDRQDGLYRWQGANSVAVHRQWVIQNLADSARVHRRQAYNAFGEVISETDGRGNVTESEYNTQGKLVLKRSPTTGVTYANGYREGVRPIERYVYDRLGRALATVDANGNTRTRLIRAGGSEADALLERAGDGGLTRHRYDIFGDKRESLNALYPGSGSEAGYLSEYRYDAASRLIESQAPQRLAGSPGNSGASALRAIERYRYDGRGLRVAHTNALGFTDTTAYDTLGRVIRTVSAQGFATGYTYQLRTDVVGMGGLTVSGWQKTTTEATGRTQVEHTDASGRRTWHQDLGGHWFRYGYDFAGQLTLQTGSTGQHIERSYYGNGLLKLVWDKVTGQYADYGYDNNGNRTYEGYMTLADPSVNSPNGADHHQHARLVYDELNRLIQVEDPRANITYQYDAASNVRRIHSSYHDGMGGARQEVDHWYAYDAENRFVLTMGTIGTGQARSASDTSVRVQAGDKGVQVAYNALGQRVQARVGQTGALERYVYSAEGYLIDTYVGEGVGSLLSRRESDLLGRVTTYREYDAKGYWVSRTFDRDSRLVSQTGSEGQLSYSYYSDAKDSRFDAGGAGALAQSVSTQGDTIITTTTRYDYWDSAQPVNISKRGYMTSIDADRNARWMPGTSQFEHDVNGHVVRVTDAGANGVLGTADDRLLRYASDAQGRILKRQEAAAHGMVREHHYYYANDQRVGDVGNDGPAPVDYAQAIAQRSEKREYKEWRASPSANFDQNYQAIGPEYPGTAPGQYTVRSGDTLAGIAATLWGDRAMWYLLAEANGLSGSEALPAGQVLSVPNKLTNVHHNAGTFKVYQAGEAMGDTAPTLPRVPPPPEPGCGIVEMIIVVVVTAVVAYYAGPEIGKALGSKFAGMVLGAAVGNIAGQITGMALGVQQEFSWSSVAISALGAAVGAGLSQGLEAAGLNGFMQDLGLVGEAFKAAAGNALTQTLAVKLGLQEHFDARGVWAAGASAAAAYQINEWVGAAQYGPQWKSVSNDAINGMGEVNTSNLITRALISNAAANVVRAEVQGEPFDLERVVANTLGDTVRDGVTNALDLSTRSRSAEGPIVRASAGADQIHPGGRITSDANSIEAEEVKVTAKHLRVEEERSQIRREAVRAATASLRPSGAQDSQQGLRRYREQVEQAQRVSALAKQAQWQHQSARGIEPDLMRATDRTLAQAAQRLDQTLRQAEDALIENLSNHPGLLGASGVPLMFAKYGAGSLAGALSMARLTTSEQVREGAWQAITHPIDTVDHAIDAYKSAPGSEKALMLTNLLPAGVGTIKVGARTVQLSQKFLGALRDEALSETARRVAELNSKWGQLSKSERVALMEKKAEANAFRRLREMEAATPKAHFVERHGAQLDLQSQYDRAAFGINPTTGLAEFIPPAATRFFSHRDQLNVITRAQTIYRSTGDVTLARMPIEFDSLIGSGFQRGTLEYGTQRSVQVYLSSNGRALSAFPLWGE